MSDRVADPAGRVWTVRRRWVPRLGAETVWGRIRRRVRGYYRRAGKWSDSDAAGCFDVGADDLVAGLVLLAGIVVFFVVGLPLLIAVFDVLFVLLVAIGGVVGRVLFRRPWVIEARTEGTTHRWRVTGWRASSQRLAELRSSLAAGVVPPS
ncbi:MAG: hypothetical protein QM733_08125 [Ilumatobacteraceae bacterium]